MSSTTLPGSFASASTNPYFGRAWKVSIIKADAKGNPFGTEYVISNSDWNNEALRVVFSVEQMVRAAYWYADIVIYNLADENMQVFNKNDFVTVLAGYQKTFSAETSTIWKGRILQCIVDREDVVNSKLTLRCLIGLLEDESAFVSLTLKSESTLLGMVQQIATQAGLNIDGVDMELLSKVKLPRGQVAFGRASALLNSIALSAGLEYWMSAIGINIRALVPSGTTPDYVFGPSIPPDLPVPANVPLNYTPTLIGTPEMTQEGVTFRVLLDSRLGLCRLVMINNAIIRLIKQYIGQNKNLQLNSQGQLDKDQSYVIVKIQHLGDTRGNTWYSDVTAVTNQWAALFRAGM